MTQYRYVFQKGSRKHLCPVCEKKCFVRYVDLLTGELLPEQYGRCDREVSCGNLLNPYTDGYAQMVQEKERGIENEGWKPFKPVSRKPIARPFAYIPYDVLKESRNDYGNNVFIQNLLKRLSFPLPTSEVQKVISLYHLGTNNDYLPGMVTFPFIDLNGNVRAIQVKQFDEQNHTIKTTFLHSILKYQICNVKKQPLPDWLESYLQNDKYVTCLFGEHMLSMYPANPIALVEAPKTAVIGTLYHGFPGDSPNNLLWLGVYNLSSLNVEKCRSLQGRKVYLFPDLKAYEKWKNSAEEISKALGNTLFTVSDFLERNATDAERERGLDLADYLQQYDYRKYRGLNTNKGNKRPAKIEHSPQKLTEPKKEYFSERGKVEGKELPLSEEAAFPVQPVKSTNERQLIATNSKGSSYADPPFITFEVEELESFFNSFIPPDIQIKLDQATTITDVPLFVRSHMATIKASNGRRSFKPYFDRLLLLKEIITK